MRAFEESQNQKSVAPAASHNDHSMHAGPRPNGGWIYHQDSGYNGQERSGRKLLRARNLGNTQKLCGVGLESQKLEIFLSSLTHAAY
jgi:hypothetical protein